MSVILEVMPKIPAFGYERITIWSKHTECIYLKSSKSSLPSYSCASVPLCVQLLQSVSLSCQLSLTLFFISFLPAEELKADQEPVLAVASEPEGLQ